MDLLDRLLIIPTEPYSSEDLKKIIKIRLDEEGVEVEPVVEELLSKICQTTSLRHTIHLISAADLVCDSGPNFVNVDSCQSEERRLKLVVKIFRRRTDFLRIRTSLRAIWQRTVTSFFSTTQRKMWK